MEGAPRTSRALFELASGTTGNKPEKQPLLETRSHFRAKFTICKSGSMTTQFCYYLFNEGVDYFVTNN